MSNFILGNQLIRNYKTKPVVVENYSNSVNITFVDSKGVFYTRLDRLKIDRYTINISAVQDYEIDEITLNGLPFTSGEQLDLTYGMKLNFNITTTSTGPSIDPVFGNNDLATIKSTCEAGLAPDSWIGGTKSITTTDNQTYTLRFVDNTANRYEKVGGGYTNGAIEFVELPFKSMMNSQGTNVGGYPIATDMINAINTFEATLPTELRDLLTTVKVKSGNGGNYNNQLVEQSCKLFPMAMEEMVGTNTQDTIRTIRADTCAGEGSQFKYYLNSGARTDVSVRIKNYQGSASDYWMRSPTSGDSYYFALVGSSGHVFNFNNAINSFGVALCFAF